MPTSVSESCSGAVHRLGRAIQSWMHLVFHKSHLACCSNGNEPILGSRHTANRCHPIRRSCDIGSMESEGGCMLYISSHVHL